MGLSIFITVALPAPELPSGLSICGPPNPTSGLIGGGGSGGLVGGWYVIGDRGKLTWNATDGGMTKRVGDIQRLACRRRARIEQYGRCLAGGGDHR